MATVTASSSTWTPLHEDADSVAFYIWSPENIEISVSDTSLTRVEGWRSSCADTVGQYQTARLDVTAEFTLATGATTHSFRTSVFSTVAGQVRSSRWRQLSLIL